MKRAGDDKLLPEPGHVRPADKRDLPVINEVIEAAVGGWAVAERVKRLSLPLLRYQSHDFGEFQFLVLETPEGIRAIAAWSQQSPPPHALLHGLYVHPAAQRCGFGKRLIKHVAASARAGGLTGMLIRAERVAVDYFAHAGLVRLAPEDPRGGRYPYRFWLELAATG